MCRKSAAIDSSVRTPGDLRCRRRVNQQSPCCDEPGHESTDPVKIASERVNHLDTRGFTGVGSSSAVSPRKEHPFDGRRVGPTLIRKISALATTICRPTGPGGRILSWWQPFRGWIDGPLGHVQHAANCNSLFAHSDLQQVSGECPGELDVVPQSGSGARIDLNRPHATVNPYRLRPVPGLFDAPRSSTAPDHHTRAENPE